MKNTRIIQLTEKELKNIDGGGRLAELLGNFAHRMLDYFSHTAHVTSKYVHAAHA